MKTTSATIALLSVIASTALADVQQDDLVQKDDLNAKKAMADGHGHGMTIGAL